MAAGNPAGCSRIWLLSQISPAVRFAAQLCTAGSAQPGDGKTWVGAWRGGSLASRPQRREPQSRLGVSACPQIPSTQALFCGPSALFPWPCWHLQPRAGGSLGMWLPGDSTFTDCRLMNPTGPALGHSVCALLQSDQSYFPTQFLFLGINQSKKAAWTDRCH